MRLLLHGNEMANTGEVSLGQTNPNPASMRHNVMLCDVMRCSARASRHTHNHIKYNAKTVCAQRSIKSQLSSHWDRTLNLVDFHGKHLS